MDEVTNVIAINIQINAQESLLIPPTPSLRFKQLQPSVVGIMWAHVALALKFDSRTTAQQFIRIITSFISSIPQPPPPQQQHEAERERAGHAHVLPAQSHPIQGSAGHAPAPRELHRSLSQSVGARAPALTPEQAFSDLSPRAEEHSPTTAPTPPQPSSPLTHAVPQGLDQTPPVPDGTGEVEEESESSEGESNVLTLADLDRASSRPLEPTVEEYTIDRAAFERQVDMRSQQALSFLSDPTGRRAVRRAYRRLTRKYLQSRIEYLERLKASRALGDAIATKTERTPEEHRWMLMHAQWDAWEGQQETLHAHGHKLSTRLSSGLSDHEQAYLSARRQHDRVLSALAHRNRADELLVRTFILKKREGQ
eukprot:gnl/Dysnectes_brevis/7605_a12901_175.p1 GENE.gnl/Dysnectes_brevis/7605_a12901_175~~gnl/Dysnectes_brevis/7605_a12901_175.p1  ORF type:complete len:429 (+),score=67.35 gnl/Dysnectes_brevis/7605_a12901_175:188-1288(+)